MELLEHRVIEVVRKMSIVEEISIGEQTLSELGFDSLKKVNLIIELENEFQIQFDDSELNPSNLNTMQDLADLVKRNFRR